MESVWDYPRTPKHIVTKDLVGAFKGTQGTRGL